MPGNSAARDTSSALKQRALRILVAEDEFLVGLMLEENLKLSGHDVIGPVGDLAAVQTAIRSEEFDLAIFDVNLGGEMIYPAAEDMLARGKPFVLLTGYGTAHVPDRYRGAAVLSKPCDFGDIEAWIARWSRRD